MSNERVFITEWDEVEGAEVQVEVNAKDVEEVETNPEAAVRIAYEIEEQQPLLLDVVAKYMSIAYDLGSKEAAGWLANYYEDDDGRYDAWS